MEEQEQLWKLRQEVNEMLGIEDSDELFRDFFAIVVIESVKEDLQS